MPELLRNVPVIAMDSLVHPLTQMEAEISGVRMFQASVPKRMWYV